ncbi:hypothetical protein [Streptomonospora wellingtoniae]|uniref:DUF4352 domain-containing protein n=1 Tax=Streptomonospora wellingtoniae TaxID=3075544 RepID=A0ABU2KXE8_9ACTN|nr:hypothetical protein [Streptomonospora sp. DSM 45055]MDT0303976.1 hypothetical protein [Streptomonospora sp. DSM 45055]
MALPTALGVPWWMEREAMLDQGAISPEPIAVAGTEDPAELVGSRWELRGTLVGELEGSAPPPDGTRLVDAVFKLTPGEGKARKRLTDCDFRAVDDQGRWWQPTSSYSMRPSLEGTVSVLYGCTGEDGEPLPAGEEAGVVVSFLVPDDAVDSLVFEVAVPTAGGGADPAPQAMRFEQEE